MRLIANRQLTGDHGFVLEGQTFESSTEEQAKQLIQRGLARAADPPKVLYQTKVIYPEAPEVSARPPFRDGAVHHAEPPPVAPEGDSVLPEPDVPLQGDADHSGRRGRKGSSTGR